MKVKIDTVAKTITIDSQIKLDELMSELERLFPDNSWKEYTLIGYVYSYPIYIEKYPAYPIYPLFPTYPVWPILTCGDAQI